MKTEKALRALLEVHQNALPASDRWERARHLTAIEILTWALN